ncbi:MAG: DNA cytosine methyltransferase [Acidithiobacillus sp.]
MDLFCGAGGLTHGFVLEGLPVVAGIDLDSACRYPYEANNGARFIEEDVTKMKPEVLRNLFGDSDIRILAGCAPCQPFSTYAQRYDTVGSPRWALLYEFARLVKAIRPDVVTMENVPTVEKHTVYADFATALRKCGYRVWHDVVDCSHYGLPQRRRRMVLLASRIGPIELIERTHERPQTVRDAIGGLPPISAGGALPSDPLHTASKLSKLNLERIRASRPGGTWRDWPKRLIAECHRRDSGRTYPGVYGRMVWDEPAPTLTTQFYGFGNGRFGHPEQDRGISLREGAILQGFPEDYSFVPDGAPIHFKSLGRMIGNAVPVTLGRIIGRSILRHLAVVPEVKTIEGTAQPVAERGRNAKRVPLVA